MRANTLTDRVTINRLGAIAGSHKTGRTVFATGVPTLLLPSDYKAAAARGLELNQAYDAYFMTSAGVEVGDEIVDQNGRKFKVKGIRPQPGIFSNHLQANVDLQVGS